MRQKMSERRAREHSISEQDVLRRKFLNAKTDSIKFWAYFVACCRLKPKASIIIFQDNAKKFLREKTFPFLLWPSHLITRHIAKFWQRFYGTQPEYDTHRSRREAEKMFAWNPLAKNSRGQRHRAKTILWPGQFIFTDLTFSRDKKVTDRPVELANVWRGGVVMSLCENRDWLLSIE